MRRQFLRILSVLCLSLFSCDSKNTNNSQDQLAFQAFLDEAGTAETYPLRMRNGWYQGKSSYDYLRIDYEEQARNQLAHAEDEFYAYLEWTGVSASQMPIAKTCLLYRHIRKTLCQPNLDPDTSYDIRDEFGWFKEGEYVRAVDYSYFRDGELSPGISLPKKEHLGVLEFTLISPAVYLKQAEGYHYSFVPEKKELHAENDPQYGLRTYTMTYCFDESYDFISSMSGGYRVGSFYSVEPKEGCGDARACEFDFAYLGDDYNMDIEPPLLDAEQSERDRGKYFFPFEISLY